MCDNEDTEEPALLLSLVKKEQLQRILAHVLDENKFLSPYGIRSLSKVPQSYSAAHYTCVLYEHLYAVNIYHLLKTPACKCQWFHCENLWLQTTGSLSEICKAK